MSLHYLGKLDAFIAFECEYLCSHRSNYIETFVSGDFQGIFLSTAQGSDQKSWHHQKGWHFLAFF